MNSLSTSLPLAKCEINGESTQTLNARTLHTFLGSRQEFSHWIKNRIEDYGFNEGVDYTTLSENTGGVLDNFIKNPFGGRPKKEYHLSMDMAKELSMVERNEKGREARRYFIAIEKAKTTLDVVRIGDPAPGGTIHIEKYVALLSDQRVLYQKYIALLEETIEKRKPKKWHPGKHLTANRKMRIKDLLYQAGGSINAAARVLHASRAEVAFVSSGLNASTA